MSLNTKGWLLLRYVSRLHLLSAISLGSEPDIWKASPDQLEWVGPQRLMGWEGTEIHGMGGTEIHRGDPML